MIKDLFGIEIKPLPIKGNKFNPCLAIYGQGPKGKTCKDCQHLIRYSKSHGQYLKCDLRVNSGGPATDHKASYSACAKWKKAKKMEPFEVGAFETA